MDVKYINPVIGAVLNVLPQLGLSNIQKKGISVKGKSIRSRGVVIILGIIGDVKGNILYNIDIESAKKIASIMMMGMPVNELDDLAQSALSEMTNMVTANASINFSDININTNISTPTLMYGQDFEAKVSSEQVLCVEIVANEIPIEINIALEI
ncbi:chemotaxis protein CheX [Clostridium sp. PL3]|uniref:Chemotaxis protein CheX n=1 Tax=Clostridium thailandense TaxID=2794346 RepID=A0A949U340_9CLOT|nr:chemotaxis protein CheX [Clostridium thailandense]MBV7276511.1 chemotaxis protein CheX [Clostridium thailandense]